MGEGVKLYFYIYYQFRINYKSYERGGTEHDKTALLAAAQLKSISLETLSESDHENGNDPNMSHSHDSTGRELDTNYITVKLESYVSRMANSIFLIPVPTQESIRKEQTIVALDR